MNIFDMPADTSLIPPYEDYDYEFKKMEYDFERFFIAEIDYDNNKDYKGIICDSSYDNIINCRTILTCLYKLTDDTYCCIFSGKKYSKNEVRNVIKMKNFVQLYSNDIEKYVDLKRVIKIFDMLFLRKKSYSFVDYEYRIDDFAYGNLKLKFLSKYNDYIHSENTANHLLLSKFKAINYVTKLNQKKDIIDIYDIYKTIFYKGTGESDKAYCLSDNQVYRIVKNFDIPLDKVCGELILLSEELEELGIKYDERVCIKDVFEYQKQIYKKAKKL